MRGHSLTVALEGKVLISDHGDVRVQTYISPEDGLLTNTQIVEGRSNLIIFDGQFFLAYAREVARYVATLGKPVDRMILSHIHLDHWSGLSVLTEHFPDAPVYSVPGIADYLHSNGQRILDARRSAFGDNVPAHPIIPTGILPEGEVTLAGVRIEFRRFIDAESALQLVALMPDLQTLLAFDLIFAPNEYVFTVTRHFEHWITVLEGLKRLSGYDRILSGHGEPTDRSAIDATIAYLRRGKDVYAPTRDPAEYASRMKAIFHDRRHPEWIDLSASLLYSMVDAYDVTDSGHAATVRRVASAPS